MKRKNISMMMAVLLLLSLPMLMFGASCKTAETPLAPQNPVETPEETDSDYKVFFGEYGDPIIINALNEEYESKYGVRIEAVSSPPDSSENRDLWRLLNSDSAPFVFIVDDDIDTERLVNSGFLTAPAGMQAQSLTHRMDVKPLRFDIRAFVANGKALAALVGESYEKGAPESHFIRDLKTCDYDEWRVFVMSLGEYLRDGTVSSFKLTENQYSFTKDKSEVAALLDGVFALPGGEMNDLSMSLLEKSLASTDSLIWSEEVNALNDESEPYSPTPDNEALNTTGSAVSVLDEVLASYTETLELLTDHIAGPYAEGIRGDDFVNADIYSIDRTYRIFADGKALFLPVSGDGRQRVSELNAKMAEDMVIIPFKMPYLKYDLSDSYGGEADAENLNDMIAVDPDVYICVNASLSEEDRKEAERYMDYFIAGYDYGHDAVNAQAAAYSEKGEVLPYSYGDEQTHAELVAYNADICSKNGLYSFLSEAEWTDERTSELIAYLKSALAE